MKLSKKLDQIHLSGDIGQMISGLPELARNLEEQNKRYEELNLSNIENSYKAGFALALCIISPDLPDEKIEQMREIAWGSYFKTLQKVEGGS